MNQILFLFYGCFIISFLYADTLNIKSQAEYSEKFLKLFEVNLEIAMNEAIPKWNRFGEPVSLLDENVSKAKLKKEYFEEILKFREQYFSSVRSKKPIAWTKPQERVFFSLNNDRTKRAFNPNVDNPTEIFPNYEANINNLKTHATLNIIPWSSFYWPLREGSISSRYADVKYMKSTKYIDFISQYIQPSDYNSAVSSNEESKAALINLYSPAEKYDLLAGTFHLVVTNSISNNKPFIIDATYDYEVWNQPIYSYKVRFFNPETHNFVKEGLNLEAQIAEAAIPAKQYSSDKFKKLRDSRSQYVIGIENTIAYVSEKRPSHLHINTTGEESLTYVKYIYDLELDENWNIIGGEWYQTQHPDFIWTVQEGTTPLTKYDKILSDAGLYYDFKNQETLENIVNFNTNDISKFIVIQSSSGTKATPLYEIVKGAIEAAQ